MQWFVNWSLYVLLKHIDWLLHDPIGLFAGTQYTQDAFPRQEARETVPTLKYRIAETINSLSSVFNLDNLSY